MKPLAPGDTERLSFRPWRPEDLQPFHAICSNPQVMRHVGNGQVWSRARTSRFIQNAGDVLRSHGCCQWALIHKPDRLLIGYCGFAHTSVGPEIGWRLSPQYWGQGLATEAACAALKHGFESLEFRQVMATVQAPNQASIRVVEKLGMQLQRRFERGGREVILYAATRADL